MAHHTPPYSENEKSRNIISGNLAEFRRRPLYAVKFLPARSQDGFREKYTGLR